MSKRPHPLLPESRCPPRTSHSVLPEQPGCGRGKAPHVRVMMPVKLKARAIKHNFPPIPPPRHKEANRRHTCVWADRAPSMSSCLMCRRNPCSPPGASSNPVSAPAAECLRACIGWGGDVNRSPPGCSEFMSPKALGVESRRRWC